MQRIAIGVCPQCEWRLQQFQWEHVQVVVCDGCGGVWLEQDRLGALLFQTWEQQDRLLEAVRRLRTGRVRKFNPVLVCPFCRLMMFSAPLGRLTQHPVHTCPKCRAVFLPHGVLDQVIQDHRR